jgi:hypothetical protein
MIGKCTSNYESNQKKIAYEWLDALAVDLEDLAHENDSIWIFNTLKRAKKLRKQKIAQNSEWLDNYQEMLVKFQKDQAIILGKSKQTRRASSKLRVQL